MSINFRPISLGLRQTTKNFFRSVSKYQPFLQKTSYSKTAEFKQKQKPRHLICFKQWNAKMVSEILISAINLKSRFADTHNKKLDIIPNTKVMILQEVNVPIINMAISKAATFLGASDCQITDNLMWDYDYHGRVYSDMADIIFVTTRKHMCIQRFADKSTVPVLCMKSRTHASIQSLATIMSIMEEYGTMQGVNVSYVGPTHPILNSYLLLCPMLGANIRFKCCCKKGPVSPLLLHASKEISTKTHTEAKECIAREEALANACVVIAGPTTLKKENIPEYRLTCPEINRNTCYRWIFYHTCPRGAECDDTLFWNVQARTFNAFQNMQYIAAALMAHSVRDYKF